MVLVPTEDQEDQEDQEFRLMSLCCKGHPPSETFSLPVGVHEATLIGGLKVKDTGERDNGSCTVRCISCRFQWQFWVVVRQHTVRCYGILG